MPMFRLISAARTPSSFILPRVRYLHKSAILFNVNKEKPEVATSEEASHTVLDISDEAKKDDTNLNLEREAVYLDTMKVYNELRRLEFTDTQSDVILKLIRENLTLNLNKLQSKMLSNIELENESYLFEAAQSELKYETQHSRESDLRNLEIDKYALERLLQLESDELNEYLIMSKNDSQVTINDQISENTLLQKRIKMKIQELDNKITTGIIGEVKSETESLRWHTTISGIIAVVSLVFIMMIGASLNRKINKEGQPTQVILRTIEPEEHVEEVDEDEEEQERKVKPEETNYQLELKKK